MFNGGKRKCFGKTLGETGVCITGAYLSQFFDLEMVEERFKHKIPTISFGQSHTIPIEVIFTKRIT